uniref:non-specific serine/threonine protein kinase n=1 Tax=Triticum aestivum TaxID=4565 RepID=A0A3B6FUK0_WHEAT
MRRRSVALLLLVAATYLPVSIATDTIDLTASIAGNQTLLSARGAFRLGFFSPPGSPAGRTYIGIWYARIPVQTVVWVANRQNPVVQSPGVLKLSPDGRLVIVDGQNTTVWSSSAPTGDVTTKATAQLLDSGNLVVSSDGSGSSQSVAWQSFDYPTDTQLPGMKVGVDHRSGFAWNMTSWSSPADPSPGQYTVKLITGGLPEFFLFRGPAKIFTTGPWNGVVLTGVPELKTEAYTFVLVSNPNETYSTYYISSPSLLTRLVVEGSTGLLQRYVWADGAWNNFWYHPTDPCDSYARCGPFGFAYCDTAHSPECSCLPGFQPRSRKWSFRDGSGGCIRKTKLSCGDGDGFWPVNNMKLPEATNATVHADMTLDECRQLCLANCSCRAYSAANISGGVNRGCVIWATDLLNMRQYPAVVQDLYIRLAQSDVDALNVSGKRRRTLVIAVAAAISGALLLAAAGCLCFWRCKARRKRQLQAPGSGDNVLPFRTRKHPDLSPAREDDENKMSCGEDDLDLPLFDLAVILAATDNFAAESKLGEGGFGPVYLGRLEDGQEVAVKRLSKKSSQGVEEFKNEVRLIAKLQHRNLVRLLGCCIDDDERLLVYEFMHNNSLDTFIFGQFSSSFVAQEKTRNHFPISNEHTVNLSQ